jgi:hypothetical protein
MLKRIIASFIFATLFFVQSEANCPINTTSISKNFIDDTELWAKKLSTDIDFLKYYNGRIGFANNIINTKSQNLYARYLQNIIAVDEETTLYSNLGLSGKREFLQLQSNNLINLVNTMRKHEGLKNFNGEALKSLISASFKVIHAKEESLKFSFVKRITIEECWWYWVGCEGACGASCFYATNYSSCMFDCSLACSGAFGFCWAIAD